MPSEIRKVSASLVMITATRDRVELLKRLLLSLEQQEAGDMHLLIIDQSSSDGFIENRSLARDFSTKLAITHVRSETVGLSRARNEGLDLVNDADIITFPDDDCWYPPTLVRDVYQKFRSNPSTDILLGQYAEPQVGFNPRFPQKAFRLSPLNAFGASVGFFFSAGIFLKSHIRFDENIGAGTKFPAAEELDVLLSALAYGYRASYDPSIVVYHAVEGREPTADLSSAMEIARSYVMAKQLRHQSVSFRLRVIGRMLRVAVRGMYSAAARSRLSYMMQGYKMAMDLSSRSA